MIEATLDIVCFIQGHFGDIYGLCASDDPEFTSLVFTAGYDGILCLYDTDKRQPLWIVLPQGRPTPCFDVLDFNILHPSLLPTPSLLIV